MNIKRIRIVGLIGFMGLMAAPVLFAQQAPPPYSNTTLVLHDRLAEMQQQQNSATAGLLQQTIELDLEGVTIEQALKAVAKKADLNLKLMYSGRVLPKEKKVTLQVASVTLYDALWQVLEGTDLQFAISPHRQLVLFPARETLSGEALQTGTLTGRVIDADTGESMPGANVYIPATGQGTSTGPDGEFQIFNIESGVYEVQITFISYERLAEEVEIEDGETTVVEFELEPRRSQLDEIVVTGYGVRREIPTGAITTVGAQSFEVRSVQTLDQVIQAQSPGFRMINLSGQPGGAGYIRIRGLGSINADSPPLFIVDGTRLEDSYRGEMASTNVFGTLNPSDIESVDILRDAEATALYGAEGANGVVLITTRRGRSGDTQFSASAQFGVSQQTFKYDMMNGPEWVEFMQEVNANRYADLGITSYGGVDYGDPREAGRQFAIATYGHPDEVNTYDWQGAMTQPGLQQRYSLSALGGTDVTQFYISAGYNDQEGTIIGSRFNRGNLRANIDHQATDRLRFELNTNFARTKAHSPRDDQEGFTEDGSNNTNSPFHGGVTTAITQPIYNEDGTWNQDIVGLAYNNVQLLHEEERTSRTVEMIGNLSALYSFTDHIGFRSRFGLQFRTVRDHRYRNPSIDQYAENGGYVEEHTREVTNWNTDHVLDYLNTFGEAHNVNALLGAEYHRMYRNRFYARGRSLPTAHFYRTLDATGINNAMGGTFGEYRKAGVFTRVTYNYDSRYYITANLRYDGSSRFGENRRWGLFYSGSLAWDLAGESFMDRFAFIDELKPRISYGITGNSGIGNYASLNTFTTGSGVYGGGTPLRPGQLGNSNLTWETARTLDIGLDWSFFGGRVYGFVDVYRKNNENLLLNRNLPTSSGYGSIADNVGTVRWEGIESEIGLTLIESEKFMWSTEFNFTYERSEVIELADGQQSIGNTIRVGESRVVRWGRNYAGVNPADGRPMWYDKDGNLTYSVVDDDLEAIGSYLPDYYGGLTSRFNYGPVSLSALFHYEYGKDLVNYTHNWFMMRPHRGPRTLSTEMYDRWQQPGDITQVPRAYSEDAFPGSSSYNALSTLDMEDGSFIRLKNVILRYQLPFRWAEVLGLRGGSLFLQGENLITWTAFKGPDPEVPAQTRAIYPAPRTIMGGFNIDF